MIILCADDSMTVLSFFNVVNKPYWLVWVSLPYGWYFVNSLINDKKANKQINL